MAVRTANITACRKLAVSFLDSCIRYFFETITDIDAHTQSYIYEHLQKTEPENSHIPYCLYDCIRIRKFFQESTLIC